MIQYAMFANYDFTAHLGPLPGIQRWVKLNHYPLPREATRCLYAPDIAPQFTIVPLHHIVPTQAKVDRRIVSYYCQRQNTSIECSTGHYPVGIRFQGDPAIYLTNGHHRLVAKRCTGHHRFGLWLYDLALTLEQALSVPFVSSVVLLKSHSKTIRGA